MIKHLVLFKLKTFESEAAKTEKISEIKSCLEALPAKIKVIKAFIKLLQNPRAYLTF